MALLIMVLLHGIVTYAVPSDIPTNTQNIYYQDSEYGAQITLR